MGGWYGGAGTLGQTVDEEGMSQGLYAILSFTLWESGAWGKDVVDSDSSKLTPPAGFRAWSRGQEESSICLCSVQDRSATAVLCEWKHTGLPDRISTVKTRPRLLTMCFIFWAGVTPTFWQIIQIRIWSYPHQQKRK